MMGTWRESFSNTISTVLPGHFSSLCGPSLVELTGHDNRAADIVIRTYVLLYSYIYASTADVGTCTAAVTTNKAM